MPSFPYEELNQAQREAVKQVSGPLLILAGAGTGKTRTLTARICHMVDLGIPATAILAVTFTNKAANEMRERIRDSLGKKRAKELTVSTFHSLCVKLLRAGVNKLEVGLKHNFSIYDATEQLGLIKKLLVQAGAKDERVDPSLLLALISKAKSVGDVEGITIEDTLFRELASRYTQELRMANAVDFDDLLMLAVQLLERSQQDRETWRSRFQHIMVDEFQDTNRLQMDLLRLLVSAEHNVCVVGDDDQSIYGWRGADISNILDFERFFPNPRVIKLEENYRSTTPILETANSLIRHNQGRREKTLWSRRPGNQKIRLIKMEDADKEAELVAREIWMANHSSNRPFEDFAVLVRTNPQTRFFETELRKKSIPYRVIGTRSFFDRREIRDVLAHLTLLVNPDNDAAFLRIINTPPRGIGAAVLKEAVNLSSQRGQSTFSIIADPAFIGSQPLRSRAAIRSFLDLYTRFESLSREGKHSPPDLLKALLEEVGYPAYLRRQCKTPEEALQREESIASLMTDLQDHADRGRGASLSSFLDDLALGNEREFDKKDDTGTGVSLITFHASKGLEFPSVYLVGLEEGILPHRRSIDEGTRDEERRLLYVGITRAQRDLTLSYCASRTRYGERSPCHPSSFLEEIARDHIHMIDNREENSRPMTGEAASAAFAELRAMLKASRSP